jgi:hypothetical protein
MRGRELWDAVEAWTTRYDEWLLANRADYVGFLGWLRSRKGLFNQDAWVAQVRHNEEVKVEERERYEREVEAYPGGEPVVWNRGGTPG